MSAEAIADWDRPVIDRERAVAVRDEMVQALLARVQEPQRREFLARIADVQARGGTAASLAAELEINAKALQRKCQRLGIPKVRRAFVWFRILWAAKLLEEEPSATLNAVAATLDYAAAPVLRRALLSCVGLTPTQLREQGPTRLVLERFVAELDTLRPRPRRQRGGRGH